MFELLRKYLGPYRGKTIIGALSKVVEVIFDLITPLVIARTIDDGVHNRDVGAVLRYGALLVCFALVGYGFTLICQKMAALVAQGVGTDLRDDLMRRTMSLSAAEMDRFGADSLVTRTTNDVNQVQLAVAMGIRQLMRFPILGIGSIVAALLIDLKLGLVFLLCVPVITLVFWFVMSRSVPFFRLMQEKLDLVSRITREALSGVRVIRAFGREGSETKRFDAASKEQTDVAVAVGRLSALLNPATLLVMNLGVVAILWTGAVQVSVGDLRQGQVMAFVNYMSQTLVAIVYVANLVVLFNRGSASAQRVMEVLDTEPSVRDTAGEPLAVDPCTSALALDHVSFSYAGAQLPSVGDVTLTLGQGETLGVIGGTGSGKSTLVSLLVRLYDVSEGTIEVLGHDVRDYPIAQLRSLVSIVPQKASLVSGTIRSNLLWRRPDADDDELWRALERAQAADFVREKPLGLDGAVEAGGKNFSGGQRQRLTIARALVGSPRLVVLDDSASALDFKTDARLRRALRELGGRTSAVIVSQRVSAVMQSDRILVLDHGRVVGLGTHRELLEASEIYREICLSQLSAEEVAA